MERALGLRRPKMERNLFSCLLLGFFICEIFLGNVDAVDKKGKRKLSQSDPDILSFTNKVILITGASSGIGAHAAVHLAKKGASVSLVGRDKKRLTEVSNQIKSAGAPNPLVIVADVTKDAQRIINETVEYFGKLNILINNAGIARPNNAEDINMDEFDLLMSINLRSFVELIKLAIPNLKKTKGNILNMASVAGQRVVPNAYAYSISKAAIIQLTKCAARDLGPSGIRVNALCPGIIRTGILDSLLGSAEMADQYIDKSIQNCPIGRVGDVTDTSAAIEYLVGDSASFVTGTILTVDGGGLVGS